MVCVWYVCMVLFDIMNNWWSFSVKIIEFVCWVVCCIVFFVFIENFVWMIDCWNVFFVCCFLELMR